MLILQRYDLHSAIKRELVNHGVSLFNLELVIFAIPLNFEKEI
jgi:hypothetical protein